MTVSTGAIRSDRRRTLACGFCLSPGIAQRLLNDAIEGGFDRGGQTLMVESSNMRTVTSSNESSIQFSIERLSPVKRRVGYQC